jgi:predicted nucleic acid-binding protein
VGATWARLVATLRAAGKRMPINDSWIAATALTHDFAVLTQDADYDVVPGLRVIKV